MPADGLPKGSDLFGALPRVLAAVGSGVGALVLIGGALLSAWRLWRGHQTPRTDVSARRLALGNVLIALGTLILSGSGTLAGRIGELEAFEVTLLLGVSVLFVGFLVATSTTPAVVERPSVEAQASGRGSAGNGAAWRPKAPPEETSAQDAAKDLAGHPSR